LISLVVPYKSASPPGELFRGLNTWLGTVAAAGVPTILIDGSPTDIFHEHRTLIAPLVVHLPVDRVRYAFLNDKVNGVFTGAAAVATPRVVLVDDDIRIPPNDLRRLGEALGAAGSAKAATYLRPIRWHVAIDAARSGFAHAQYRYGDSSTVFAIRTDLLRGLADYFDGDVLFDNWELERCLRLAEPPMTIMTGPRACKVAPTTRTFLRQCLKQPYEDLSFLARTAFFLAWLPGLVAAVASRTPIGWVLVTAALLFAVAATAKGLRVPTIRGCYPLWICLIGPVWITLRSALTYPALALRVTRGYSFGGRSLRRPARRLRGVRP